MEQLTFDFDAPAKACSTCGVVKPLKAFSPRKRSRDGLDGRCRACINARRSRQAVSEYNREYYRNNGQSKRRQNAEYQRRNAERLGEQKRQRNRDNAARNAAYYREYRRVNAERIRARRDAYYAANRDQLLEHRRQLWAILGEEAKAALRIPRTDEARATARRWRHANSHLVRAYRDRRRLRVAYDMDATDRLLSVEYRKAITQDRCTYCGKPGEQIDHMTPLARGGTDHWWNLQRTCKSCNCRKRTRTHEEFLASGNFCRLPAAS